MLMAKFEKAAANYKLTGLAIGFYELDQKIRVYIALH